MLIRVKVSGCDDSTRSPPFEATEEEFAYLQRLAAVITACSTYGCMPTMSVEEPTEEDEYW